MGDMFQEAVIISVLAATVRIATPLLLAALGELVTERAGILNLGVEGTMLMAALSAFLATYVSGSFAFGMAMAVFTGMTMAALMVTMAAVLKVEQVVTGLALNLLAVGLSAYFYKLAFDDRVNELPTVDVMQTIAIPYLSDIPYIGEILFNQKGLTYFAILMVPVVWFMLYRTKFGLELRCLGENPKVIDTKGMSVTGRQFAAVLFGGAMSGLAGAFVTIGSTERFVPEITAGRGWLAIVIVIAGNWRPVWILVASLVFAFLEAFQLQVQGLGVQLPYQVLLALPYVAAIAVMVLNRQRSQEPKQLGVPYFRGER